MYNSLNQRQDVLVTFAHWTKTSKEKYSEISLANKKTKDQNIFLLHQVNNWFELLYNFNDSYDHIF